MNYTACIQPLERYLRITTTGTLATTEMVMEYLALVVRMANEYSQRHILLDETRVRLMVDVLTAYAVADSPMVQEMVENGFRLACLSSQEQYPLRRSAETILCNRSLSYLVFLDEDEAVAWLTR